ncbi:MAG: beta-ketoacyl synthase N-terminal-like domain-containing protein [Candidatus Sumerlaeota bacterium]
MALAIHGIGIVTPAGNSLSRLRETLQGEASPRIENDLLELKDAGVELPVYRTDPSDLGNFVKPRSLRRLDRFTRMALLASYLAREDCDVEWPGDSTRVGLVFGSGHGPLETTFAFQDSLIESGDQCASPTAFANSVHNSQASQVAISMGIQGPCQTVTTQGQTPAGALGIASSWLRREMVDYVLVGLGDEYDPLRGYAFANLRQTAEGGIAPFDFQKCSALPGEGFVALVLGRDAETPHGRIERLFYGHGVEIRRANRERIEWLDAVIMAAHGDRDEGPVYRRAVGFGGPPVCAYAPHVGASPTMAALDLVIASLSLSEGSLFASPDISGANGLAGRAVGEERVLGAAAEIGCLRCCVNDHNTLTVLRR